MSLPGRQKAYVDRPMHHRGQTDLWRRKSRWRQTLQLNTGRSFHVCVNRLLLKPLSQICAPTTSQAHDTHAVAPTSTNGWARGTPWVREQQSRNWPSCTAHHESTHQNDYFVLVDPNKWRGTTKKKFWRPSHFKIHSGANTDTYIIIIITMYYYYYYYY